jgi:hypothetical protein
MIDDTLPDELRYRGKHWDAWRAYMLRVDQVEREHPESENWPVKAGFMTQEQWEKREPSIMGVRPLIEPIPELESLRAVAAAAREYRQAQIASPHGDWPGLKWQLDGALSKLDQTKIDGPARAEAIVHVIVSMLIDAFSRMPDGDEKESVATAIYFLVGTAPIFAVPTTPVPGST